MDPITIADIKEIAKAKLRPDVWSYYITGADDEQSVRRNESIYERILLRPRVLRDVTDINTSVSVLGKHYSIPIAIAPSAYQKLAGGQGEIDVARAAFEFGTNFTLSSNATTRLEDTLSALPPREEHFPKPWFQLYFLGSTELTLKLIQRAECAGYEALVLTVDTPILGNRLHERRKPLELPSGITMDNAEARSLGGVSKAALLLHARSAFEYNKLYRMHRDTLVNTSLDWKDTIPWLRSHTNMKIILKGIMTGEDAQLAVEAKVDAIIVSNHGGRQLDGVPSTLEALPEIADAVNKRIPVIFDGGISRGSDVFKAMALGADLCLIGRSALWGLAWDGQKGVASVLHILERELARTMALMGVTDLKMASRSMLGKAKDNDFGIAKL
ncbi:FMN-dependent dehydrogenase [Hortaea werneckii]|nr:FMN-dependent dehydrogenase [Hortaea werneckii]KAI7026916.1 FMN-dependent dehydrogenase [Hortaea werneckii]KAI7203257.1 FMN-dependent dehydrogenase [Hortaea werneckii]KAI7594026.1 FMN-dependent dehydrogenase [Hortaea werneckii]KAI7676029.1 FMN-dependent dehydrogenase [Hortaea werneckii]